jgi:hypothetical protein
MSKIWIRIISFLEIVGGLSGIAFLAWQISARSVDRQTAVLAAIALAIYLLSLIAGIALWRATAVGRVASIVVQAIQLPKYISQLLIFMFSFGFDAYIYGMLTNNAQPIFGFEFKFLAFNQLFVNVADAPAGIGISIPACIFIVMLLKFKPQRALLDDPSKRPEQALAADSVERVGY